MKKSWYWLFGKPQKSNSYNLDYLRKLEKLRLTILFDFKILFKVWDEQNDNYLKDYQIHLIEVDTYFAKDFNTFKIIITCGRPGLIIGKEGRNLNKIKNAIIPGMLKNINKGNDNFDIAIHLKEFDPFNTSVEQKELEKIEANENS